MKQENNEQYYRLLKEEKRISDTIHEFIIATLKENKGKITFTPEKEEDSDGDYPVTAIFGGNKDNPNIDITDVYLDKHDRIFADGYNAHSGILETNLEVETWQYMDILYFIGFALGWENPSKETEEKPEELELTILFGSDVIAEYSETGEFPSEEWLLDNGGVIDTKQFKSKELMEAYLEGLSSADGWLESLVLDPFMIKLLEQDRAKSNR
jgi:hypothetical protein